MAFAVCLPPLRRSTWYAALSFSEIHIGEEEMKMLTKASLICFALSLFFSAVNLKAEAATRRVPADYPTVQQAMAAAVDGDTVLIAPGTYFETINFLGKAITVTSESGPQVTIIDGQQAGSVVRFVSGEGPASVLSNLTIRNGYVSDPGHSGGGIFILLSSPTIKGNIISDNAVEFDGGGMRISGGAPVILGNTVTNNRACHGAGIFLQYGSALIQNNTVTNNRSNQCSTATTGAGINIAGGSGTQILYNLIANNFASGGGVVRASLELVK